MAVGRGARLSRIERFAFYNCTSLAPAARGGRVKGGRIRPTGDLAARGIGGNKLSTIEISNHAHFDRGQGQPLN